MLRFVRLFRCVFFEELPMRYDKLKSFDNKNVSIDGH